LLFGRDSLTKRQTRLFYMTSSSSSCNFFTSVAVRESELLAANACNFGSLQRVAVSCCSLDYDNVAVAL